LYTPDVYILDTTNNQYIYVPPSGYVGGQFAYNDQNYAVWFSPAGLQRGVLPNVVSLRVTYDAGDRATLAAAQVNPIKAARNGSGNVIWDVWTLSTPLSLLSYVSIRRTFIYLEQSILTALEADVFANITPQTEFLITQAINAFLQPILNQQGITNFLVLCNNTNNPANLTDEGELVVTVYIVPVVPARIIALRTVITPNSVSFSELISQGIF
jgi:phage tail sheath protein FI